MLKEISKCRICLSKNLIDILDLGHQPPANSLHNNLKKQKKYPLKLIMCNECKTSQLSLSLDPKLLFNNYFWVTGTSKAAKEHAKKFYKFTSKFIPKKSTVIEIASNDGTFLKPFQYNNFKILGIDPAKNISKKANKNGVNTISNFFSFELAKKIKKNYQNISLIFARNVIPHVKNINSVVKGISELSDKNSVVAIEFHYSKFILEELQYDSIYHEHIFYFSIKTITKLFNKHKLYPFDVFSSPISGGSIVLIFSKQKFNKTKNLKKLIKLENSLGINKITRWKKFSKDSIKHSNSFKNTILKSFYKTGKLFGYGASARSSTLLNFCKLNNKYFEFIIDKNSLKHNYYTPGTNIKILSIAKSKKIIKNKSMVLLAWNFKYEIVNFMRKNGFKNDIILPIEKNDN